MTALRLEWREKLEDGSHRVTVIFDGTPRYTAVVALETQADRRAAATRIREIVEELPADVLDLELDRLAEVLEREDGGSDSTSDASDASDASSPEIDEGRGATAVVRIALAHFDLGQTPGGDTFVVPKLGSQIVYLLDGDADEVSEQLALRHFDQRGEAVGSQSIKTALTILKAKARALPRREVYMRVGLVEDTVWLDTGSPDGAAVAVRRDGWSVTPASGVLFRRSRLIGELPQPVRGGSLGELHRLLNVDQSAFDLIVGWLVAALRPGAPQPIALFQGEQGTGKSTAARILSSLLDPGDDTLLSPPADERQWGVMVGAKYVLALDNLQNVPPWLSVALCRAVTGETRIERQLYTNTGLSLAKIRRALMLTSIDPGALQGDLVERIVLFALLPIPGNKRRLEREILAEFRAAQPRILGALLDLVVAVQGQIDSIELRSMPRMADFSAVLAAVDRVRGTAALETYRLQERELALSVVESDPVASSVQELIQRTGEKWVGSATALLRELRRIAGPPPGFPNAAHTLSGRLMALAPALKRIGILVEGGRETSAARTRWISIRRTDFEAGSVRSVRSVRPAPETHPRAPGRGCGLPMPADAASEERPGERPGTKGGASENGLEASGGNTRRKHSGGGPIVDGSLRSGGEDESADRGSDASDASDAGPAKASLRDHHSPESALEGRTEPVRDAGRTVGPAGFVHRDRSGRWSQGPEESRRLDPPTRAQGVALEPGLMVRAAGTVASADDLDGSSAESEGVPEVRSIRWRIAAPDQAGRRMAVAVVGGRLWTVDPERVATTRGLHDEALAAAELLPGLDYGMALDRIEVLRTLWRNGQERSGGEPWPWTDEVAGELLSDESAGCRDAAGGKG